MALCSSEVIKVLVSSVLAKLSPPAITPTPPYKMPKRGHTVANVIVLETRVGARCLGLAEGDVVFGLLAEVRPQTVKRVAVSSCIGVPMVQRVRLIRGKARC